MKTLLRSLEHLVTFDDEDRELRDADVLIDGQRIVAVGVSLPGDGVDRVIDGSGLLALPGLVNAHQHLYQAALRALPELERAAIGPWLAGIGRTCLEWWRDGRYNPEMVGTVSRAILLESLLGGTTTVADQYYFFPGGEVLPYVEETIEAAKDVGVRLHAARGSITLGASDGGAADDVLVESVDGVVRHCQELIERYHDPKPLAMTRIALAPCGLHVDRPELFDQAAAIADSYAEVALHTHLYERIDTQFCADRYDTTPWRMLEAHGWAGSRTWLAHMNDPPAGEVREYASSGAKIAHLIAPDLRLGWGLAPVREYLDAGVTLGFGTTGSASNDGANMLGDLRLAALAHRVGLEDPSRWLSCRELLRMATRGSAACLGRSDLGVIAPGYAADIACWDLTTVDRIGVHDPVVGLVLAGLSDRASLVLVNGEVLVEGGEPVGVDAAELAGAARAAIPS